MDLRSIFELNLYTIGRPQELEVEDGALLKADG